MIKEIVPFVKGYKYRIYPNKEQQEQLAKVFGSCRFVYNNPLNIQAPVNTRHYRLLMLQAVKKQTRTLNLTVEVTTEETLSFIDTSHLANWMSARLNAVRGVSVTLKTAEDAEIVKVPVLMTLEKYLLLVELHDHLSLICDLKKLRIKKFYKEPCLI